MSIIPVTLAATPTFPHPSAGSGGAFTGAPAEPYSVRVVDMDGVVLIDLPLAFPGDITETLNGYDEFDISFPKGSVAAPTYARTDIEVLGRDTGPMEVQILLGTKVIAWGPAISPEGGSSSGTVTLHCAGVDWYFAKRNLDEKPVNLLSNADFEDDFTDWSSQAGVTADIETDRVIDGTKAARLTQAADNGLGLASVPFNYTTGRNAEVLTYVVSFILEEYLGPAAFKLGIILEAGPPGGAVVGGVNTVHAATYNIDETTDRGVEVRTSLSIRIPPNVTWAVKVTLFGPKGSIVWDAGFLQAERAFSTLGITGPDAAVPDVDVSTIVRLIATQALTAGNGKSDLRIGLDLPTVGVRLARLYPHADHIPVDQALAEFVGRDDCFDYGIVYTDTTRTLRIWPIADGPALGAGRGTNRAGDITLGYGSPPAAGLKVVDSFVPNMDGGGTVTQAAALGDGSGGAREERWYSDASQIGGTVLQGVFQAPANGKLNSLLPLARATIAQQNTPPKALEVTIDRAPITVGGDDGVILQDLLELGDIVNVDIVDGYWVFHGGWRIVQRVRHCRARTMTYTLNRVLEP